MSAKPATRLYVDAALAAGMEVALAPEAVHRLRAVLRLRPGDAVALFNGRDGEWLARIDGQGHAVVGEHLRAQEDDGDLWLVFALIKRPRLEWMIEKATELGVAALIPVTTERTVAEKINAARLAAITREAAEQCERLSLPSVRAPQSLASLIAGWPANRRLILCDETGRAPPLASLAAACLAGPAAILVGPEGGFAESELDGLGKLPNLSAVGLGPRVLRSETAALAALAVVQALGGGWSIARRRPRVPAGETG
ncbi:MAG TPA: 16S rRNA (uracil(1498)-N(3))-methyltransferase [Stellaceae bacterium]|nr:16S rRNA (uracil(1498)-N(3))-methyltransferase [Stellaceae bacterium]